VPEWSMPMNRRTRVSQSLIDEIIRRVVEAAKPERIVLFGSAAAGKMTPDSDIDVLVLEASPGNVRQESVRLWNALRGLGHPFDVVVMSTERFEGTKNLVGGIAYPANRYGRVIYEAA